MGIDAFNTFLKSKFPNVYSDVHLSKFAHKKVCFDISSFVYKFISSCGKEENKWLNPFINMIMLFRRYSVHVIPVFDGKAPPEKDDERANRGEQKEKGDVKCFQLKLDVSRFKKDGTKSPDLIKTMKNLLVKKHKEEIQKKMKRLLRPSNKNDEDKFEVGDDVEIDVDMIEDYLETREKNLFLITKDDLALLKTMLRKFKIPYLDALDEAEALCNFLVKKKLADATFSLDSDCIAHQVPVLINSLDIRTGDCKVIYFSDVCNELELQPDEITLLCILLGNDYNRHCKQIKGIGPVTGHKLIKKWKTYNALKQNEKKFQVADDGLRYDRCVELFDIQYPDIKNISYWSFDIDMGEIVEWLTANHLYCDREKLKAYWRPTIVYFEESIISEENDIESLTMELNIGSNNTLEINQNHTILSTESITI